MRRLLFLHARPPIHFRVYSSISPRAPSPNGEATFPDELLRELARRVTARKQALVEARLGEPSKEVQKLYADIAQARKAMEELDEHEQVSPTSPSSLH